MSVFEPADQILSGVEHSEGIEAGATSDAKGDAGVQGVHAGLARLLWAMVLHLSSSQFSLLCDWGHHAEQCKLASHNISTLGLQPAVPPLQHHIANQQLSWCEA